MPLPKSKPAARAKLTSENGALENVQIAAEIAVGQKALDVMILDVSKQTDIANYFVIASGTSDRHVKGVADKIQIELQAKSNEKPISISGYDSGEWILLDYANYIVHVFYEPTREFFKLEQLWENADRVSLPDKLEAEARKLNTGMRK